MQLKFTRYLDTIENETRIILINKRAGSWMKISKECFDILENAIHAGCDEEELYGVFEDDGDRDYFRALIEQMKKRKIVVDSGDQEPAVVEDISIDFTNRCNLHCRHCIADANAASTQREFTTQEFKAVFQKLLSLKPKSISISGGEPLTRSDFFELCENLRSNYSEDLYLMTNGTLVNESNASKLAELFTSISISLDGADEASSRILRDDGAFTKAVDAIKILQSHGCNDISASMVETAPNRKYVPKFIELCKELNVYPMVRAFAALGRGEQMRDVFSVRDDYCAEENLIEEYISSGENNQYASQHISGVCSSAFGSFYMDAYGNIFPCTSLCSAEYKYGNIKDIDDLASFIFDRVYESSSGFSLFKSQFPENDPECSTCKIRHFCWHCISQHLQAKAQNLHSELLCRLQKNELSSIWNEGK